MRRARYVLFAICDCFRFRSPTKDVLRDWSDPLTLLDV
jgi:hypothetical protein